MAENYNDMLERHFQEFRRSENREDFEKIHIFTIKMMKDVLTKYKLEYLLLHEKFHNEDIIKASSPYCEHIGEAIIAISNLNRHKFLSFLEPYLKNPNSSEYFFEEILTFFCKDMCAYSVLEDSFLIVCGFVIDYAIFLSFQAQENKFAEFSLLFSKAFCVFFRTWFYEKGGWDSIKINAKPWWYIYRNNLDLQENTDNSLENQKKIDFHNPVIELCNPNFMLAVKNLGLDNSNFVFKLQSASVQLKEELRNKLGDSCPICTLLE